MQFAIYVNNTWQSVQVEIEPKLTKAFDTTNDSFSCILKADANTMPYKPMTPFRITDDNNVATILWVINDTVSIFSLNPILYKHNLSLVQYRYFLNKYLVRNTVFSQPRKAKQELFGSTSCELMLIPISDDPEDYNRRVDYQCITGQMSGAILTKPNYWSDNIPIGSHTRIKRFSYKYELYGVINPGRTGTGSFSNVNKLEKITTFSGANLKFNPDFYWQIINLENDEVVANLSSPTNFNTEVLDETTQNTINAYLENAAANNVKVTLALQTADTSATSPYEYWDFAAMRTIINHDDESDGLSYNYDNTKYQYVTMHLVITIETYNYTMYDVIKTSQEQYRLLSDTQSYKRDELFLLPRKTGYDNQEEKDLYDLLTSTYSPDTLSFTQATFYDALSEIFRFYDAGFKFDTNKRLQIEYYNDPINNISERFIDNNVFKAGGEQLYHNDKNFNNGRVAYYQNALFPIKTRMNARSKSLGVPGSSDYGILLQKPIYNMGKISIDVSGSFKVWGRGVYASLSTLNPIKLDITPFVVNDQEYSALNKRDVNYFSATGDNIMVKYQINTLHYNRGGDFISLSETYTDYDNKTKRVLENVLIWSQFRFFGYGYRPNLQDIWKPTPNYLFSSPSAALYENQHFLIEYLTENNGRARLETLDYKYGGEQIVNQNDGLIDLNKLGINALGESFKDGEPILSLQCEITDWNDRIKEGDYFIKNNEIWVANIVNYSVVKDGVYQCSVEFSKNFNALSMRIKSDNAKRLTNISSDAAILSEDNFVDYVYLCDADDVGEYDRTTTILDILPLTILLGQTFGDSTIPYANVDFAYINSYDLEGHVLKYGDNQDANYKYIPLIKYGFGNSICFEMQFGSPISAGYQLTKTTGWFGSNKYFSQARLYTDDEGWADVVDVKICSITEKGEKESFMNYPDVNSTADGKYSIVGSIDSLHYYKKPNEIFALNYEWCFLSVDPNNLFIGSKFININIFTNPQLTKGKKFYLRYGNEKYSVLDTKGKGNIMNITSIFFDLLYTNAARMRIKVASPVTLSCWAVVDENNDIYIASNISKTFSDDNNVFQVAFFTNKDRKY